MTPAWVTKRKPLGVVALTVIISACAVAGCGGGSKSTPATPSGPSPASTSANTTTGAYRKSLEREVATLSSDVSTFASCTISFSAPACRSWAVADKGVIRQFLTLLAGAQVPAGDASDDAALRRLLISVSTSDIALLKAINAVQGNTGAVSALTGKIKASIEQLNPLLNRLDPGLGLTVPT